LTTLKYKEEEVAEVPAEIEAQFKTKNKVKIMQEAT
jgi:hypothetical protein